MEHIPTTKRNNLQSLTFWTSGILMVLGFCAIILMIAVSMNFSKYRVYSGAGGWGLFFIILLLIAQWAIVTGLGMASIQQIIHCDNSKRKLTMKKYLLFVLLGAVLASATMYLADFTVRGMRILMTTWSMYTGGVMFIHFLLMHYADYFTKPEELDDR